MRIALGNLTERLILATESLAGTKLGQGIAKVEAGILRGYDKAKGVFGGGAEAAASKPKKAIRFAEWGAEETTGVKWVDEKAGMNVRARSYNDGAPGARSNAASQCGQAPSLSYVGKDGKARIIRFDGLESK